MKKVNFKFKHGPSLVWLMNTETYESFKNCCNLEYNTDTSALHSEKNEDIVRAT